MTDHTTSHDEYAVNTGSSGDLTMVRLDSNGEPYKEPFAFEDYDVIDKGLVEFEITGFQSRFEMNRPAQFMKPNPKTGEMPSPTQPKTRLEFTIINGPQAGKRWLGLYTWAVGETATLGMLIRAITQSDIPRGWRMTDVIGLCGRGYVKHSIDKTTGKVKTDRDGNPYADLSVDTVEPVSTEPLPAELQPAPRKAAPSAKVKTLAGKINDYVDRNPLVELEDNPPALSWNEVWAYARTYGINPPIANLERELGVDTKDLSPAEVKALIAAHVGDAA